MKVLSYLKTTAQSPGALSYLISGFLSGIGDWIYFVGITSLLYQSVGVTVLAALTLLRQLPYILLAPIAGQLVDRYKAKPIVAIANLTSTVAMIVLAVWTHVGDVPLWAILLMVFINGTAGTFDRPTRFSVIPRFVQKDSLLAFNTLMNMSGTTSLLIAPLIGGLVLKFGTLETTFWVNGASFVVSLLLFLSLPEQINIPRNREAEQTGAVKSLLSTVQRWSAGFSYVFTQKRLRSVAIFLFMNHVAVGATYIFVTVLSDQIGLGKPGIGYLTAMIGYGSLVGTFLGAFVGKRSLPLAVFLGVAGFGASVMLCGVWVSLIGAFVTFALMGIFANIGDGPMWTMLQQDTPDEMAGRVYAAVDAFTVGGLGLGSILTGVLLGTISFGPSLLIIGGLMIVAFLLLGSSFQTPKTQSENLALKE